MPNKKKNKKKQKQKQKPTCTISRITTLIDLDPFEGEAQNVSIDRDS